MPILDRKADADAEGAAEREAEFQQLKLALHLAQVDRAHYVEEMNSAMVKMKQTIESLEQEGAELLEKIRALDSKPNQMRDQRTCEDLVNLAENKDWLQEQINAEKAKHMDLDAKIRSMEKKVSEMKVKVGGTTGADDTIRRVRTKLTTLENRLVHVLKTYNEEVGKNMQLRNEIDTLRMQRANFDLLYRKLDQTLSKQRLAISQLIEATSLAYEQREDAAQRIQQLTEKAEKDTQQHNNEMKELVRLIDHDRKLKLFMKTKSTERQEDPQLTAWKAKRVQEADERRAEVDRLIESYENAFDRMLEVMEESNPENLVQSFLEKEDRNFALFNYVNETNAEIERLNEENETLATEIDNYQEQMTKVIGKQKDALAEWQADNDKAKEQQSGTQARLATIKDTLKTVCELVLELVTKLDCDTSKLTRRLASSEGVTQSNLLDYLTLIEQRVNKLLLIRQFIAVNDPEAPYVAKSILIGNNLNAPTGSMPTIHPPNLQDDFDETSELSLLKPFTREELHRRVVSLVRKKEQEARSLHSVSMAIPRNTKIS
ncbi:Coiled-coil domain-containing protein 63 [Paragonimus heterotremus]|uniref:Coiled-coil domain-containing protein 63 n=1 Tax=Paragonimus heterotremus TaxID=100268 RepID=A0A8J4T0B3_9TREM|nr:Coiled-coil domain-containing protein 63 [Paragonimus heterotremus]